MSRRRDLDKTLRSARWSVAWIGHVVMSPDHSRIPHVEVLLTPAGEPLSPDTAVAHTYRVSHFRSLAIGRRFNGFGHLEDDPGAYGDREEVEVYLDSRTMSFARVDGSDVPGLVAEWLLPFPRFRTTRVCVITDVADGQRQCVIIPCFEIVRYFYNAIGMLPPQIFTGRADPASLLGQLDDICFDGGSFRQRHRADITMVRRDVLYDWYAARQAHSIFLRAVVSNVREGVAAIEAVPPVIGKMGLSYSGYSGMLGDLNATFVSRIHGAYAESRFPRIDQPGHLSPSVLALQAAS